MNDLPSLHVIGDSISIDYGPHLEAALAGTFRYSRKTGEEEARSNLDVPMGANGGDSGRVRAYLESLKASGTFHVDLLLVNCGLHDIKTDPATGEFAVGPGPFASNLDAIVTLALELADRMVWISITPVNDLMHAARKCGFGRTDADVARYNEIALRLMLDRRIPVLDLGRFTRSLGEGEAIFRDGVHFLNPVKQAQAAYIAGWLSAAADSWAGQ